jgi:hypothetical protein
MKRPAWMVCVLALVVLAACGKKEDPQAGAGKAGAEIPAPKSAAASPLLRAYPLDALDGLITQSGVAFDARTSADGRGSLMISTESPTTVRLFETGDIDIENARIIYRAKLRTAGVEGKVYLEMWCSFPGVGEAFSRALQSPLSGTTGWTSQETPFFLKPGENPDNIKLNVVIEGRGRVWIDDIRIETGPPGEI